MNNLQAKIRVYVSRIIPEPGMSLLRKQPNLELIINQHEGPPPRDELLRDSRDCVGALVLPTERVDEEFLNNSSKLKTVSTYSVGVDHIDVAACTRRGIIVTNTPDVLTDATADLAFALILAASRRICESDRYIREKKWVAPFTPYLLVGKDLAHATIGIVGFGRIGQAVARRAAGFGMKILYCSHSREPEVEESLDSTFLSLEELLTDSDIVTLHAPLTSETRGMIGSQQFSLMKKNAVFVNTSRGGLVDQDALGEALKNGSIFAAGLDVYEKEPLPLDSPLLKLENIVLVPHIGSASNDARAGMSELSTTNLIDALNGKIPRAIVNMQVLQRTRN